MKGEEASRLAWLNKMTKQTKTNKTKLGIKISEDAKTKDLSMINLMQLLTKHAQKINNDSVDTDPILITPEQVHSWKFSNVYPSDKLVKQSFSDIFFGDPNSFAEIVLPTKKEAIKILVKAIKNEREALEKNIQKFILDWQRFDILTTIRNPYSSKVTQFKLMEAIAYFEIVAYTRKRNIYNASQLHLTSRKLKQILNIRHLLLLVPKQSLLAKLRNEINKEGTPKQAELQKISLQILLQSSSKLNFFVGINYK